MGVILVHLLFIIYFVVYFVVYFHSLFCSIILLKSVSSVTRYLQRLEQCLGHKVQFLKKSLYSGRDNFLKIKKKKAPLFFISLYLNTKESNISLLDLFEGSYYRFKLIKLNIFKYPTNITKMN